MPVQNGRERSAIQLMADATSSSCSSLRSVGASAVVSWATEPKIRAIPPLYEKAVELPNVTNHKSDV